MIRPRPPHQLSKHLRLTTTTGRATAGGAMTALKVKKSMFFDIKVALLATSRATSEILKFPAERYDFLRSQIATQEEGTAVWVAKEFLVFVFMPRLTTAPVILSCEGISRRYHMNDSVKVSSNSKTTGCPYG